MSDAKNQGVGEGGAGGAGGAGGGTGATTYTRERCGEGDCGATVERRDGHRCGGLLHGTRDDPGSCGRFLCDRHLVGTTGPFFCAGCWARRRGAGAGGRVEENPAGVGPLAERDGAGAMAALRTIWELHAPRCEDAECLVCGVLSCPRGEPLHFHHDGCPACAMAEAAGEGTEA